MALPYLLCHRFPPSPAQLFNLTRGHVDDSMLWEIARADYGQGAQEAFAELRSIRDQGVISVPISGNLSEVLELTRWIDPERPSSPPFESGPTGTRGHHIRLFACAVLVLATSEPPCQYHDTASDSTLANCVVSAGELGAKFNDAVGSLLSWQFQRSDNPTLVAIALLTVAIRLRPRMTDPDLNRIAEWAMAQDAVSGLMGAPQMIEEPTPLPFGVEQGFWRPVALELEREAMTISDPTTRENIRLCAMLLESD